MNSEGESFSCYFLFYGVFFFFWADDNKRKIEFSDFKDFFDIIEESDLQVELFKGGFVPEEVFVGGAEEYFGGAERGHLKRLEDADLIGYFLEIVGHKANVG